MAFKNTVRKLLSSRGYYYLLSLLIIATIQATLYYNLDNLTLLSTYRFYYDLGLTPYQVFHINRYLFTSYQLGINVYMWFAYPPGAFYLLVLFAYPYKLFHIENLHLQVILGRLQSIVAYYLLALFGYFFVLKELKDKKLAMKFEKLLLFNPLVILTSALVALFDTWIALFFLVTAYFLFRNRFDYAGLALGFASMIKQTAAILFMPSLIYTFKNGGLRKTFHFIAFYLIAIFITLFPLINQFPQILDVAVLFHLERPAQVFNINMVFYLPLIIERLLHSQLISLYAIVKLQEISALLIVGIFTLILTSNLLLRKRRLSKFEFLYYTALFYFIFLFGYKVVSPQHFVVEYVILVLLYLYSGNRKFLNVAIWLSMLGVSLMVAYIVFLGADIFVNYPHVLDEKAYLALVSKTVKLVNLMFTSWIELFILGVIVTMVLYLAKKSYLPLLEMLFSAIRLRISVDRKASRLAYGILMIYITISLLFTILVSLPEKFIFASKLSRIKLLLNKLNATSSNSSFIKVEFNSSQEHVSKKLENIVLEYYRKNFEKYVCFTSNKIYLNPSSCQL